MMQTSRFYLDGYLTIAMEAKTASQQVYAEILAWKGTVLARQRQLRLQRGHPELAAAFAQLNQVNARLAALALAVPDSKQLTTARRRFEELTEEKERLESGLASRSVAFRKVRETERLTPTQLQNVLPTDTALIDFIEYTQSSPPPQGKGNWVRRSHLAAFVVRPASIHYLDLGLVKASTEVIDRWRASYGTGKVPPKGATDPASELSHILWKPLQQNLQGVKMLLLSPDGPLHGLPWAALPGSKDGTFLVHEYSFAIVPVPILLPEIREKKSGTSEAALLLMGGIDFGEAGRAMAPGEKANLSAMPPYNKLAGTESEVNDLRAQFERTFPDAAAPKIFKDDRATKAAFLQNAAKYPYIHLATHGFFSQESEKPTLDPETPHSVSREFRMDRVYAGRNPSLLSGIVFAGVNDPDRPKEDGVITALEAGELDLSKTELVVLSACDTGLGRVAGGEGVLGLQRAFQMAGARTVVASLWQVPDEETHQLMREFYRRLWDTKKPVSRVEALRQAQLWMLENAKRGLQPPEAPKGPVSPHVWAAFVLSGDWR